MIMSFEKTVLRKSKFWRKTDWMSVFITLKKVDTEKEMYIINYRSFLFSKEL